MAHVDKNIVTLGVSGMLGKRVVFRRKPDGGTVLAARPSHHTGAPTASQENIRTKFLEGVVYAKSVMGNPELKAAYKSATKPGVSVYAYALGDYMKDPAIKEVNVKEYTGQPGSTITVRAIDNFRVTSVTVGIRDEQGRVIEGGIAVKNPDGINWTYTATEVNGQLSGAKVEVTVTDTPGHKVTATSTL